MDTHMILDLGCIHEAFDIHTHRLWPVTGAFVDGRFERKDIQGVRRFVISDTSTTLK